MGANGSTAASCSSLDIGHGRQQQQKHCFQQRNHQQLYLDQQRKYRKQQNNKVPSSSSNQKLKHSTSYFDLTATNFLQQHDEQQEAPFTNHNIWPMRDQCSPPVAGGRPYALGPKLVGACSQSVSPAIPPPPPLNSAKKSNAGVASRILHQRQQQQLQQQQLQQGAKLKKFSDSLPSLNNLLPQSSSSAQQQHHHQHQHLHQHQQANYVAANFHNNNNFQQCHKQKHFNGAKQYFNKQSKCNNLVNNDAAESRRRYISPPVKSMASHQMPMVKRATSLSSLHNLHQQHNNHNNIPMYAPPKHQHQLHSGQCVAKSKILQQRPESMGNNYSYDLQTRRQCEQRQAEELAAQQHQLIQYNQPMPLAKKFFKFKQVSSSSSSNGQCSKKYKQKQLQRQQQQQAASSQQQQQGCQVLPQLPRSQSLHELIQLRATENGQRMRTTGTLRGPLNGSENSNKVNLVAELLENRRQNNKKNNDHQAQSPIETNQNSIISSQSSSSDDGIHDVSLNGDHQSTNGSGRPLRGHYESPAAIYGNAQHSDNLRAMSTTSQDRSSCSSGSGSGRQRLFKKNTTQLTSSSKQKRFSQSPKLDTTSDSPDDDTNKFNWMSRKSVLQVGNRQDISNNSLQNGPKLSTLKRSASQSALSAIDRSQNENDCDESDDLNELAKFLYQFKMRQANRESGSETTKNRLTSETVSATTSSSSAANINKSQQAITGDNSQLQADKASKQQQSPNSTTSSSGFASSTCTSHSISSSDEGQSGKTNSQNLRKAGRKKYPAPARPDELIQAPSATASNLISGKLKLSSSLLSIVDEYNSTLKIGDDRLSPALIASSSSNLASVLLGNDSCDRSASALKENIEGNSSGQLEKLQRYTQLRQMSQSELALNQLASVPAKATSKQQQLNNATTTTTTYGEQQKKRSNNESNKSSKAYKSGVGIINLIRRISDKSEVGSNSGSSVGGRWKARLANGSGSSKDCSAGSGAINQTKSEITATKTVKACANECEAQQKLPSGQQEKSMNTSAASICLSESLRDLNFDCDFELIKNCGSTNERSEKQQQLQTGSSLLPSHSNGGPHQVKGTNATKGISQGNIVDSGRSRINSQQRQVAIDGKGNNCDGDDRRYRQIAAINSSKGENNWRLVSQAGLLAADNSAPSTKALKAQSSSSSKLCGAKANKLANGNELNNGQSQATKVYQSKGANVASTADCQLRASDVIDNADETDKSAARKSNGSGMGKLKWSASAWLMNGGAKSKQQQQQRAASGKPTKSDATYNIRDPKKKGEQKSATSKIALADAARSEADQLLIELDNSLNLIDGDYSPDLVQRKPVAVSWWHSSPNNSRSDNNAIMRDTSYSRDKNKITYDSDDDDSDDDNDYASINRAMINETFDAADLQQKGFTIESPSNSFTFSAPSSRAASPDSSLASNKSASKQSGATMQNSDLPNASCKEAFKCGTNEDKRVDKERAVISRGAAIDVASSSNGASSSTATTTTPSSSCSSHKLVDHSQEHLDSRPKTGRVRRAEAVESKGCEKRCCQTTGAIHHHCFDGSTGAPLGDHHVDDTVLLHAVNDKVRKPEGRCTARTTNDLIPMSMDGKMNVTCPNRCPIEVNQSHEVPLTRQASHATGVKQCNCCGIQQQQQHQRLASTNGCSKSNGDAENQSRLHKQQAIDSCCSRDKLFQGQCCAPLSLGDTGSSTKGSYNDCNKIIPAACLKQQHRCCNSNNSRRAVSKENGLMGAIGARLTDTHLSGETANCLGGCKAKPEAYICAHLHDNNNGTTAVECKGGCRFEAHYHKSNASASTTTTTTIVSGGDVARNASVTAATSDTTISSENNKLIIQRCHCLSAANESLAIDSSPMSSQLPANSRCEDNCHRRRESSKNYLHNEMGNHSTSVTEINAKNSSIETESSSSPSSSSTNCSRLKRESNQCNRFRNHGTNEDDSLAGANGCLNGCAKCTASICHQSSALEKSTSQHHNHNNSNEDVKLPAACCVSQKLSDNNLALESGQKMRDLGKKNSQILRHSNGQSYKAVPKHIPLFGRLRSSLLNTHNSIQEMTTHSKLSTSQLSLASYYGNGHGQFLPTIITPKGGIDTSTQAATNFDDNFILKRKTPNAGLKTRC